MYHFGKSGEERLGRQSGQRATSEQKIGSKLDEILIKSSCSASAVAGFCSRVATAQLEIDGGLAKKVQRVRPHDSRIIFVSSSFISSSSPILTCITLVTLPVTLSREQPQALMLSRVCS